MYVTCVGVCMRSRELVSGCVGSCMCFGVWVWVCERKCAGARTRKTCLSKSFHIIFCFTLQVSFRKRVIYYRALLRKLTYEDRYAKTLIKEARGARDAARAIQTERLRVCKSAPKKIVRARLGARASDIEIQTKRLRECACVCVLMCVCVCVLMCVCVCGLICVCACCLIC